MPLKDFEDDPLEDEDEFEGPTADPYPHYEDLPEDAKAALRAIKAPTDIQSSQVMEDWRDDHQLCVGVVLNGITFGAWWCGWEVAGAFQYWESPKAREEIVEYIQQTTSDLDAAMQENAEIEARDNAGVEALRRDEQDPNEITPEDLPPRAQ